MHSDSDVAALVYRQGDNPDALPRRFSMWLTGQGFDLLGVVQHRDASSTEGFGSSEFLAMPDGRRFSEDASAKAVEDLSPVARIEAVAAHLSRELRRRPDLVILNRFGSFERAGLPKIIQSIRPTHWTE